MESKQIYLSIGTPISNPDKTLILLPHIRDPITIKKALQKYPCLYSEFDGTATECTLLYNFKWNKHEKCFEPIDEEAENELVEILGVELGEFKTGEEDDKEKEDGEDGEDGKVKKLTKEQHLEFHDHIADIRLGLARMGMGK